MITVITELSKYIIIFFFAFYTISGFLGIGLNKKSLFVYQRIFMFIVQFFAYLTCYLKTEENKYLYMYLATFVLIILLMGAYRLFYSKMSVLIINNMCMLLVIGGFMLARLSFAKAVKQYIIVVASLVISMIVPVIIRKCRFLSKLTWVYAAVGIVFLAAMKLAGTITYGASITFTVAGITLQPVEFVKILFVFFLAAYLSRRHEFKDLIIVSVISAVHVLLLVWAKELGGALILFVVYLALIYIASHQPLYVLAGLYKPDITVIVCNWYRRLVWAWIIRRNTAENSGFRRRFDFFCNNRRTGTAVFDMSYSCLPFYIYYVYKYCYKIKETFL